MKGRSAKSGRITSSYFRRSVDEEDVAEETNGEAEAKTDRRMTLPAINIKGSSVSLEEIDAQDSGMGFKYDLARRASVTNVAICCSIAPSLAGVFPRVPDLAGLRRSATENNLTSAKRRGSRWQTPRLPFLRLQIPEDKQVDWFRHGDASATSSSPFEDASLFHQHCHNHHHHHPLIPHIHVPTFTFSTPDGSGRKFSFGIRRSSQATLHRTESMISLCYRTLVNYISEDDLAALTTFLDNKRIQIDDRDENGSTALIFAASKGKIRFVRELVNHGADVNAEDSDNWTALLVAAKEGFSDICLELLEHNADLEHRDEGGWSALMWAAYQGKTNTVMLLLSRGADVNAHGDYHISSLLWAAGRGHSEIVKSLLTYGAKVNFVDKYGTTALVWASRKGNVEIVDTLLKAGATVDTAGLYSWTPLLVATLGNHVEVVLLLLEHKPNVNALDKDGCTALTIACREGFYEIANALLNAGAYINIQDKSGDTNLIHAVKSGYKGIVELLLKKYADVDITGKDRKTAVYIAVEKGNVPIVKLLLNANPDLEIATKDGDTPLLRAVRSRNAEIVQLLLDKKAKISATDKKGDTVLHIAMRARSKGMVEILLRNPKNTQLLYQHNKQGETPYSIDYNQPKAILKRRRLNTNEDNEKMLGYDLYSSSLADILCTPNLSTPITVGLYAKWGSGKSFLLEKLRDEMKIFAHHSIDPTFTFSFLLFIVITHIALLIGVTLGLALQCWITGLITGVGLVVFIYLLLALIKCAFTQYDWCNAFTVALATKLNSLKLILQVIFCNPPVEDRDGQPIKFYFTEQTRVGTPTGGENAVVQIIASLYDAIESEFGSLATRLYRAFRPKAIKTNSSWKWRHLCCLPYVVIFEFCFCSFLVGISVLTVYMIDLSNENKVIDEWTAHIIMIVDALLIGISIIANLYTWSRTLKALVFSQRRHLQRNISKLESLKSVGFIETLRSEVHLMTEMIKCLDSFTSQKKSRLVVIVDGLDSCEQDKVLLVLDAIQELFSEKGYPFVVILAIDPHIIAKAVEVNGRRLFTESNIGGHDYLRNMVHLPFYLQNSGLRKVKVAQQTAQHSRMATWTEAEENVNYTTSNALHQSISNRRLSTESGVMMTNSNEKLKPPSRKGSRKLRLSESIASSIGSNLNRLTGPHDLNKILLTDDYFSDINPRSMRRLLNVLYITGRLLQAFHIDFDLYHLAMWINITEQWPFRTSWMILYYEMCGENLDDSMSLKSLYDKVRPQIPVLKDVQPLLEMDRDEQKLDVFLTLHRSNLLVSELKIFLPFTINLDPYIKKKIKEEQQSLEEDANAGFFKGMSWTAAVDTWGQSKNVLAAKQTRLNPVTASLPQQAPPAVWPYQPAFDLRWSQIPPLESTPKPLYSTATLPNDIAELRLSSLAVNGVCDLLDKIDDFNSNISSKYKTIIKENNISGRVLLYCDLQELKNVLKMSFGDWEIFRMIIIYMREQEMTSLSTQDDLLRNTRFTIGTEQNTRKELLSTQSNSSRIPTIMEKEKLATKTDSTPRSNQTKHSIMEKQVTLEDQMICEALQTLSEESSEDVLEIPSTSIAPTDSLPGETTSLPLTLPLVIVQEPPKSDQSPDSVTDFASNL